ncbi:hypothetical protein [Kosakonia sp. 1610]|uniref:hypothetical protein n=1 Tax=Kosakonia sp. 1610 TaxID=3156426 RepID=UPI003D1F70DE
MGALELETHYDMAGRITHRRCTDNLRDRLVPECRYQWDRADQIIRRMYTDGAPPTPAENRKARSVSGMTPRITAPRQSCSRRGKLADFMRHPTETAFPGPVQSHYLLYVSDVPGHPVVFKVFLTYLDHQQLIEKLVKFHVPNIHTNVKVDFEMLHVLAEGYKIVG